MNIATLPGTHLYTRVERGAVRVKCLAQEYNTMSPARARTRTARSGVELTNHEATSPPPSTRKGHLFPRGDLSLRYFSSSLKHSYLSVVNITQTEHKDLIPRAK